MDHEPDAHSMIFVSGFLLGAIVGVGMALLAAPQAGTRTRRRIKKVAGQIRHSASDHLDDLAEDVKERVDDAVRGARDRFVTHSSS